jgi:hypothetical protein
MQLYAIIDVEKNQIAVRTVKGKGVGGLRVYSDLNAAKLAIQQMIKTDVKVRNYRIAKYIEIGDEKWTY